MRRCTACVRGLSRMTNSVRPLGAVKTNVDTETIEAEMQPAVVRRGWGSGFFRSYRDLRHGRLGNSIFAPAICSELLAACAVFVLAKHEIILESGLLDKPLGSELATAYYAAPRKPRDVIASKPMVGGNFSGR
jgi:hypothetical protein